MILNNFDEILTKREELKPLFKIFIKHFQQEIAFIEQIIQDDEEEIKKEASCCYCILKKINCFKKKVGNRFEMFNRTFYKTFNQMSPTQRQDYFLELLTFIQVLGKAYQEYLQKHKVKEDFKVNKYKTHITTILLQKFVSKDIVKQIEVEQQNEVCLELMVKVDGKESQKVGRFKGLKFQLIEKVKGIETQIFFNIKNYLPINVDSEALTIKFSTIYQTIKPVDIELCFKDHHSQKNFDKYLKIFTELMKVGKIQKLVRSIDIFKIFGKNFDQNKDIGNTNSLMKTFVSQEQYHSIHQKDYVDSEDIIRSTINFKKRFQRLQTIKQNRYEQVKRKLIETLNVLAQKKEKQHEKVKEFLKKSPIKVPKQKSQAVIRALNSTQASVSRGSNNLGVDVPKDLLNRFLINPQESNQKLSIINGKKSLKQTAMPQHKDSFVQSDGNKSFTSQQFHKKFQIQSSKSIKLAQSYQNVYVRLYPHYVFSQVQSLMDMIKIQLKPLYIVPDQALIKESKYLSGQKLSKFKTNWLDKLYNTVKLYCRKKNANFIKLFIPFPIQLKSLVQALVNVENYPKWHPNIKKSEIISMITSQNMITYRMEVLNPVTNKIVSIQMIMHLFKFEGKYYIIQKSLNNSQQQNKRNKIKGWFNIFNKSSNSYRNINFLMMRISNINKNGFCEMVTTIDYAPIDEKNSQKVKQQITTIFSNFVFIANYWKQPEKERKFNPSLFDYDWILSKSSFDQKQQKLVKDVFFDNLDRLMNQNSRIIEKNQQKGNGESSSEFIHSSQFYDL